MAHNIDSMAYIGEEPWHGLGNAVHAGASADEMIKQAGLDWTVDKTPIGRAQPGQVGSRFMLTRKARDASEQDVPFGVVSHLYKPLQNAEAFRFFDPFIKRGVASFETAGALGSGERVWVLARMPGQIEIVPGDEVSRYLLLSNTHDGRGSVTIKFTPIRVVCQNTLVLAMKDGEKAFSVRHSPNAMTLRLDEVSSMIGLFQAVFDDAARAFQRMVKTPMDSKRLDAYLEAVLPRTPEQRAKGTPERWARIQEAFESGRPTGHVHGTRNTLWAAYNAITYDEDYRKPRSAVTDDSRLNRVWFGEGADRKLVALQKGMELAAAWR